MCVCACVCVGIRFPLKFPDCKASSCAEGLLGGSENILCGLGQRAGINHNPGSGRLRGSDEGTDIFRSSRVARKFALRFR